MDSIVLKALYYIRKEQKLMFYRTNSEATGYKESYIYAIKNNIYPFFQKTEETDLYNDFYSINKETVSSFIQEIDKYDFNKDYKTFYQFEDIMATRNRDDMIAIFRYCYLEGKFNTGDFWKILLEQGKCPDEAKIITEKFVKSEIC